LDIWLQYHSHIIQWWRSTQCQPWQNGGPLTKPLINLPSKSNYGWAVHFLPHWHIGSMMKADLSLTKCREAF
jgi:hypothetical protein